MNTEKIGIREFRTNMAKYLQGEVPIEVVRHGHTVGYYFPVRQTSKIAQIKALQDIAQQCQELLGAQDIDEEEIIREFRAMRAADRATQERKK